MSNESTMSRSALYKEAIGMAWPAVLESFFVSLAGMIDTMMVSSLGTYAVASTGLTTQPKFLALSIFMAVNVPVSALVARRRGQGNRDAANQILLTAMTMIIIACVVVSFITVAGASTIISWCGSNADTHQGAVTYYRVIMAGTIFNVLSLVINAAQRGSGNTKIAMTTNITSSTVNVIFNYLLITGNLGFPRWELFGAAFATVLGTVAACFMSIRSLFNPNSYVSIPYMKEHHIRPSFGQVKAITGMGSNILAENLLMRVGFIVTAVIAAGLGTDPFAVHQVGMNFLSLGFSFGDGMQVAAVALIGRSLGEGKPEKAKAYGNTCQTIGLAISIIYAAILFFGGHFLFSLFFSEEHTIAMSMTVSKYIMVVVLFQISQIIFGGCLRGAGDLKYCMFASMISVTLIRSLVTFGLTSVFNLGLAGIWIGILSDQMSRFIFLSLRFRKGEWVKVQI